MKVWGEFLGRLDEVIGAGMLTTTALVAMLIGYDSSVAQMSITGVVALLAVKTIKPRTDLTTDTNKQGDFITKGGKTDGK